MPFKTKLDYFDLPRGTLVELRFPSDDDCILFYYTSESSTHLGCSIGIKMDNPILRDIYRYARNWKLNGIPEHIKPTSTNPRDFFWTKFLVDFNYMDLIKILEFLHEQKDYSGKK